MSYVSDSERAKGSPRPYTAAVQQCMSSCMAALP